MKSKEQSKEKSEAQENKSEVPAVKKQNYFKKKREEKKIEKNEDVKIVVNLTKCSSNWVQKQELKTARNGFKFKKTPHKEPTKKDEKQTEPQKSEEKKEIWFDIDHIFIPESEAKVAAAPETNGYKKKPKLTRCVAIDCEMVGVGEDGKDSILARVSLVNQHNECIYDKFVQPTERVTDYRTSVSGVRPDDLKEENGAVLFETAQKEVAALLRKKTLVGHAVQNDLKILYLSHQRRKIRDTQKCKVFRKINPSLGGLTSLKNLAKTLLGITIQEGEHSSVQDAQAAMRLYTMFKKDWELDLQSKKSSKKKKSEDEVDDESATKQVDVVNKHQRYIENKLKRRNKNKNFKNKK